MALSSWVYKVKHTQEQTFLGMRFPCTYHCGLPVLIGTKAGDLSGAPARAYPAMTPDTLVECCSLAYTLRSYRITLSGTKQKQLAWDCRQSMQAKNRLSTPTPFGYAAGSQRPVMVQASGRLLPS